MKARVWNRRKVATRAVVVNRNMQTTSPWRLGSMASGPTYQTCILGACVLGHSLPQSRATRNLLIRVGRVYKEAGSCGKGVLIKYLKGGGGVWCG